jgi:threonine dehydratase
MTRAHVAADITNILSASRAIDPIFLDTPLIDAPPLDAELGCRLIAKVETVNPIRSFKGRGAEFFAATQLRAGEPVVCASAGNFGQGLAWAGVRRGHACTVFAAETANPLKVEAMRRFGADVRLTGSDFDEAKAAACRYADEQGVRFVEDGDEAAIAEGAGTIGLELVAAAAPFDIVLVPLGDGALLEGVGTALRHVAPTVEIIAVVAAGSPAVKLSVEAGRVIEAPSDTIADGIAARAPVPAALDAIRASCDTIVAVSDLELLKAMALALRHFGLVLEPSGAAGIAAIVADPDRFRGRRVTTVLTGSNISPAVFDRLVQSA